MRRGIALIWAMWRRIQLWWLTVIGTSVLRLKLYFSNVRGVGGVVACGPVMVSVHRSGRLILGKHIKLNSSFFVNPVGAGRPVQIWVGPGATLRIGNNVGISHSTIVCHKQIEIEDDVMVGGGCSIFDTDFHSLDYANRVSKPGQGVVMRSVSVGPGAFIGAGATVLKGSVIGSKAVVGAGSVVAGRLESNTIYVGNPLKIHKKL